MITELEFYIKSYFGVAENELAAISAFFERTTLKKGEYFLRSGKICKRLSFQNSGLMRVYVTSAEKDIMQWIFKKGYFVTDLSGLIFNKGSKYDIRALTDCELFTIRQENYARLGETLFISCYLSYLLGCRVNARSIKDIIYLLKIAPIIVNNKLHL